MELNLAVTEPSQQLLHLASFGGLEDGVLVQDFLVKRLRDVLRRYHRCL